MKAKAATRSSRARAKAATKRARARWSAPLRIAKDIRWSKVMTAQARMATGYYDRKDVKEMVLEAVLKELARH